MSEAIKLWNDIQNFVKDFGIEVAPRTMNSICFDNAPSDFIRNQMSLIGADDDLVKTAYATNLFGVIFLDGCRMTATSGNDSFYIVPKTKKTF